METILKTFGFLISCRNLQVALACTACNHRVHYRTQPSVNKASTPNPRKDKVPRYHILFQFVMRILIRSIHFAMKSMKVRDKINDVCITLIKLLVVRGSGNLRKWRIYNTAINRNKIFIGGKQFIILGGKTRSLTINVLINYSKFF